MSIMKPKGGITSRRAVVGNNKGAAIRGYHQQERTFNPLKRHAARRAMARAAVRANAPAADLREVLEALGICTTPQGMKQAITTYKNFNGGQLHHFPKKELP